MKISVRWLNEYLDPTGVTAEAAEQALTHAGFPIETTQKLPDGDTMLDVEVTSNRGDCLSHIGVAREVAAATGRKLLLPRIPAAPAPAAGQPKAARPPARLENRVPTVCRLFTARIIKGVKIGPSPAWMARNLEAVGQRPINNIVDITNYVQFEFGQPTHVFDLSKLRKDADGVPHVIVRYAKEGEKLTLLDGRPVALKENELVVADAGGAVSLAGIMGGADTGVIAATTDVLLEAATWDPATIRRAARRLQLKTDASHRFERLVDPRTIDIAARRAAALLAELGGGTLLPIVLSEGAPAEPPRRVSMRTQRCRAVLGLDIPTPELVRSLRGHEIEVKELASATGGAGAAAGGEEALECIIPPFRPDLTREIDLVEEVARTNASAKPGAAPSAGGLDRLPIHEKMGVRVAAPQASEQAVRELGNLLAGQGFFETITFSFISPKAAAPFLPSGLEALALCDERRKADPILRPSIVPSLLACRRANQDGGVTNPGGVRLFEVASVFAQEPAPGGRGHERETRVLALLADAVPAVAGGKAFDARQDTVRLLRGTLEAAARALGGAPARLEVLPAAIPMSGYEPGASAEVRLNGERIGVLGLISQDVQRAYDLHAPVGAAEVAADPLIALYPPGSTAHALPAFPGIERDLSLVVGEDVAWSSIESLIAGAGLGRLDGWEFVTTYRGPQAGAGKKSVTVRLRFRDPQRTLRHEEVDPQVQTLVTLAGQKLGATLRA